MPQTLWPQGKVTGAASTSRQTQHRKPASTSSRSVLKERARAAADTVRRNRGGSIAKRKKLIKEWLRKFPALNLLEGRSARARVLLTSPEPRLPLLVPVYQPLDPNPPTSTVTQHFVACGVLRSESGSCSGAIEKKLVRATDGEILFLWSLSLLKRGGEHTTYHTVCHQPWAPFIRPLRPLSPRINPIRQPQPLRNIFVACGMLRGGSGSCGFSMEKNIWVWPLAEKIFFLWSLYLFERCVEHATYHQFRRTRQHATNLPTRAANAP